MESQSIVQRIQSVFKVARRLVAQQRIRTVNEFPFRVVLDRVRRLFLSVRLKIVLENPNIDDAVFNRDLRLLGFNVLELGSRLWVAGASHRGKRRFALLNQRIKLLRLEFGFKADKDINRCGRRIEL